MKGSPTPAGSTHPDPPRASPFGDLHLLAEALRPWSPTEAARLEAWLAQALGHLARPGDPVYGQLRTDNVVEWVQAHVRTA